MSWATYDKDVTFDVPKEHAETIIGSLLSTDDGNKAIYILGLHGYIFPEGDIYKAGRVSIKGKQGEDTGIEFNYEFSSNGLIISQFQSWGLNVNFAVRIFKEFVHDNIQHI